MIKLSDFVFDFLVKKGVKEIFLVSGGGIMHLTDSVKRQQGLRYTCNHHEQACAIAAESYARLTNKPGVCLVTTGPGSTNALSGIAGAWVDSLPVLVISGQVKRELIADYSQLRQFGPQEANIMGMASPVTKYARTIMDPASIRYELECALYHASEGRPGPVWINIPIDVQDSMIDETALPGFTPPVNGAGGMKDVTQVEKALAMLYEAKRPVLVLGAGIRMAGAEGILRLLLDKLKIPALTTIGAIDVLEEDHPVMMGRFGVVGQRRANFTLQNADLLISLGASMSVASIGYNTKGFAPKAKKIMVNIDRHELDKPSFVPELAVHADVKWFITTLIELLEPAKLNVDPRFLEVCLRWKHDYPTITPDYFADHDHVNSYVFAGLLSDILPEDAVLVTGNSLDIVSIFHSFRIKKGQRVYTNINWGSMGWDMPGVVGACIANDRKETILVTGDGSIQFNIQELNTISHNNLPVKIFVLNNNGYESIRATQNNFFHGNLIGADPASGVGNPDFSRLADSYKFSYIAIQNNDEINDKLKQVFAIPGPVLCELNISPDQARTPKVISVRKEDGTMESRPLEDQFPFIPREELARNMNMFPNL